MQLVQQLLQKKSTRKGTTGGIEKVHLQMSGVRQEVSAMKH